MKTFTIDIAYCTSVTVHNEWKRKFENTEEGLVDALKHSDTMYSSTHSEDHPEFAKLREQLGQEGYIIIERGWWNGDMVNKPFILNDKKFKKGDQFPSSAAIKWTLEH
jgi:hypothetical protein